jgi:hypothetical protein
VGTRATRADAELAVNTPCFAVAAGTIFAEAMRSSRHQDEGARPRAEFDPNDSESRRRDDDLTVVHRRAEPLLALGYPLRDPAYLALSDVDLREIERLIGNGRPAETAVRMAG